MYDTPMMRQYSDIKQHKDGLFSHGDFTIIFEDAKLASKILGITLTARSKVKALYQWLECLTTAESYIRKLIKAGVQGGDL